MAYKRKKTGGGGGFKLPYTDEFNRIRNRLKRDYKDQAKAETFAFRLAFRDKIPTFRERERKFKRI